MLATATLPRQGHPYEPWLRGRVLALYDAAIRGPFGARGGSTDQKKTAFRNKNLMTDAREQTDAVQGIEAILLAERARIIRFLELRGAGDAAEDIFQDLWMRLTERQIGPIGDPLPYIMRAANNLMLDRYRSSRQREKRDHDWSETQPTQRPSSENALISRELLVQVEQAIDATGERPARAFRRFRVDGVAQRDIAIELGVSLSTVEADLRKVYAALAALRRQFDAS